MKNLIYHRVLPRLENSVLNDGALKSKHGIICFSRDVHYLELERPFLVVFDRDTLKYRWKVSPYCLFGHSRVIGETRKFIMMNPIRKEREERCYTDEIPLTLSLYYGYDWTIRNTR